MKCSNCWSRRIAAADTNLLHKMMAALLMMRPVKCRHCFHSFHVPLWAPPTAEADVTNQESTEEQQDALPVSVPFKIVSEESDSQSAVVNWRKAA